MKAGEDSNFYEIPESLRLDDSGRRYYVRYMEDGGIEYEFPADVIEHIYETIPGEEYYEDVFPATSKDHDYEDAQTVLNDFKQLTFVDFLLREYNRQQLNQ